MYSRAHSSEIHDKLRIYTYRTKCVKFKFKMEGDGIANIAVVQYCHGSCNQALRFYPVQIERDTWIEVNLPLAGYPYQVRLTGTPVCIKIVTYFKILQINLIQSK